MELTPQLRTLRDFYYTIALQTPGDRDFVHAPRLMDKPQFFTLEHLKRHLNNPLLAPAYFGLYWQGKKVDVTPAISHKVVQGTELLFLNKGIIEEYFSRGASVILEGLDLLEPTINAMCAAIDKPHDCVSSNSVVFFSQRGNELYRGHLDTDDVLVIHLAGSKKWRIHRRQSPRKVDISELPPDRMGELQAEIVMQPGDALFMRAGTPHSVETVADFSMHMSFDICDRQVNADTALHLLLQEYQKDSAACYSPTPVVMDKVMAHARGEAYVRKIAELQTSQRENYRRARALLANNRVSYLDQYIAAERNNDK
jgi:ribosomal protein L16 Arg81 hydroxylase